MKTYTEPVFEPSSSSVNAPTIAVLTYTAMIQPKLSNAAPSLAVKCACRTHDVPLLTYTYATSEHDLPTTIVLPIIEIPLLPTQQLQTSVILLLNKPMHASVCK